MHVWNVGNVKRQNMLYFVLCYSYCYFKLFLYLLAFCALLFSVSHLLQLVWNLCVFSSKYVTILVVMMCSFFFLY